MVDLARKDFKNYRGETVKVPDFVNSSKWARAAEKAGVKRDEYTAYAQYYEAHPYIQSLYQTVKPHTSTSYGVGPGGRGPVTSESEGYSWFFTGDAQQKDPFAEYRVDRLQRERDGFTVEGDRARYNETRLARDAIRIKGPINPITGATTQTIRPGDPRYEEAYNRAQAVARNAQSATSTTGHTGVYTRKGPQYESVTGRTEKIQRSGRVVNGAFIDDNLYNALDEQQRQYYGLTFAEAYGADPGLNNAARVIDAAHNNRRARRGKGPGPSLPSAQAGSSNRRSFGAGFPTTVSRGTLGTAANARRSSSDELKTRRDASGRRTTVISGVNALR